MKTPEPMALAVVVVDLAGWYKASRFRDAMHLSRFIDAYYGEVAEALGEVGARVVKFIGDGVLAVADPTALPEIVSEMPAIHRRIEKLAAEHDVPVGVGTNIHYATVAAGDYGPDGNKQFDVIGAGVDHTFVMGGGSGIRISEPVYRKLPSDARAAWNKHRPPATYIHK